MPTALHCKPPNWIEPILVLLVAGKRYLRRKRRDGHDGAGGEPLCHSNAGAHCICSPVPRPPIPKPDQMDTGSGSDLHVKNCTRAARAYYRCHESTVLRPADVLTNEPSAVLHKGKNAQRPVLIFLSGAFRLRNVRDLRTSKTGKVGGGGGGVVVVVVSPPKKMKHVTANQLSSGAEIKPSSDVDPQN